jgi:DNA-binding SARP family transcriptional activator/WD40 repeat protein
LPTIDQMITVSETGSTPSNYHAAMRFRVLGPLSVTRDDGSVSLGGPKPRLLLAMLIRAGGRPVATDTLIDALWGDSPPTTARKTVQVYVHGLRNELGDTVRTEPRGYSLEVNGDVDAARFERLQHDGHLLLDSNPTRAGEMLREALALWVGPAYADLSDEPALAPEIVRLENLRIAALGDRIEADLALGGHDALIGELEGLTREYPLQERFRAQHMIALYRSGRQVEALRGFERHRRHLADEIGVDPSDELRELEQRILARDSSLNIEVGEVGATTSAVRGYELRERVGSTPVTETHRAYQRSVGREVAVRILGADIANRPDFIADFLNDTQRVAALEHPHIVFVFDTWREPGRAYQVSRWLGGGSLEHRLRAGPISPDAALAILDQVGDALGYAHDQGVIHGRIHASNVLLDETGNAYLSDFSVGLADSSTSIDGDIADFSVLAHRLLTGREPRNVEDGYELSVRGTDVSRSIAEVLDAALVRREFSRIDHLLRDLRRATGLDAPDRVPESGLRARSSARNPYKGLRAFQEADAGDFYGRADLVEKLVRMLDENRLVAVVGPSGSGKSSLVKAGLTARLRDGGSRVRLVTEMFPGAFPFEELEGALMRVGVNRTSVIADLVGDERGLMRVLKQILPGGDSDETGTELVLIIDQFEEIFSAVDDERTRELFLASLVTAVTDPRSRLRVVLTLRGDFFDRPLAYADFGTLVQSGLLPLTALDERGLADAIARPALAVGVELEPGLVPQIMRDIGDQPGGLPLMQYALTELFDSRESDLLTLAAYERTGGVLGALGRRAEEIFDELDAAGKHAIRQAFLRMVTVDESAEDLRRRVRRVELSAHDVDDSALASAIAVYGSHRLLTFDLDPVTRGPTVEVAHEALLREWGQLRGWLEAARDDLVLRRRVEAAMAEWDQSGREPSYLPAGGRLAQFREWSHTTTLSLAADERAFLDAAELREAEAARRAIGRRRRVTVSLAAVAAVLAVVAAFALAQRQNARDAADAAETGRLSSDAVAMAEADPVLALLLAAEAHDRAPGPETLGALQQVMIRTGSFLGSFGAGANEVEWKSDRIVALGPTGLTAYDSSTTEELIHVPIGVRLTPALVGTSSSDVDGIASLFAVSSSGRWAIVGIADDAVLVDLDNGITRSVGHAATVTAVEFSSLTDLFAVGDDAGRVTIYDGPGLDVVTEFSAATEARSYADVPGLASWTDLLPGYEELAFQGVNSLAFSADDSRLATGHGATVRIWSSDTGEQIGGDASLSTWANGFPYFPQRLEFADGRVVAHGFETLTEIDSSTGEIRNVVPIPTGRATGDLDVGVVYRNVADGRALAIAGDGRLLDFDPRLGSTESRPVASVLPMRTTEGLAVSPDGRSWAIAGPDALMIGSLDGRQLLARALERGTSEFLSISGDGSVVTGFDGLNSEVRRLSSDRVDPIAVPDALRSAVVALTGRQAELATFVINGGAEEHGFAQYSQGRAQFYAGLDFDSPRALVENILARGSISPDGTRLAHARCTSGDAFADRFSETGPTGYVCDLVGVNVVDLDTGDVVGELWPPGETATLDWSADGGRLVHTTTDGVVTTWATDTWTVLATPGLGTEPGTALLARDTPDGRHLATVDPAGVVSLREPESGAVRSTLTRATRATPTGVLHSQGPWFSLDGSVMLTSFDGAVRLWDAEAGVPIGAPFPNDAGIEPGGADGRPPRLVTAVDQHLLVWNLDMSTWPELACRAAGRNMTRDEWREFGPADTNYRATCSMFEPDEGVAT